MSAETRTTSSTGGQKGVKLERFDLIPVGPLTELARHYGKGARKYASHQWRQGYEWSKSYAALTRHLTLFWAGEDYDVCSNDPNGCAPWPNEEDAASAEPDTCFNHTGSHHMAAVAWHAFLLLEFKDCYPQHDDRYKPEPEPRERNSFTTWFLPNLEMTLRDVSDEQIALLTGGAVNHRHPRFSMSIASGETEDWDPLGFINEAFKTRD